MRRLVILVQVNTGMRFSEIRALEVGDFDATVPGLWVRRAMPRKLVGPPKNKKARLQVIPRDFAPELEEYVSERDDDALMFRGQKRHTSGSSYAVMGACQRVIATLLSHADVGTTQRYIHMDAASATEPFVEERWRRLRGDR